MGESTQPEHQPSAPSSSPVAWVAVLATAVLLAGVSIVVWVAASGPVKEPTAEVAGAHEARRRAPSGPKAAEAGTEEAPSGLEITPGSKAQAELRETVHGRIASTGAHFWLVTYENVGDRPIGRPAAIVKLFGEADASVLEGAGWSEWDRVEPGASVPLVVMVGEAPSHARAELSPRVPKVASGPSKQMALAVTEHERQSDKSDRLIVGKLENRTDTALRFIKIVAVGRDADGGFVSYATGTARQDVLAPSEEGDFSVKIGAFVVGKPQRYEVFALGLGG